jgi:hypothetical protein
MPFSRVNNAHTDPARLVDNVANPINRLPQSRKIDARVIHVTAS